MSEEEITVNLGGGIVEVVEIDDFAKFPELKVKYKGKRVLITGSTTALRQLLSDVESRTLEGWDQPAWYYSSAKAAAKKLREALGLGEQYESLL